MMSTRSASVWGFESISANTGWRLPVRALITTTGEFFARLLEESLSPGSLLRRAAASESRPGTFVISIEPGLKPSARFMSAGSIGAPSLFLGIDERLSARRRPVGVEASAFV